MAKWIDVKEKKPEPYILVLCWCQDLAKYDKTDNTTIKSTPGMRFGYYIPPLDECRVQGARGFYFDFWTPIPKPPVI